MVKIGSRIRDPENFRGTVRYIGPVAVAKDPSETWLGIEWDSLGRGKHDGSCVDNSGVLHRYFKCLDGYGSFVKPSKVTLGRSFVDVLKERYVEEDAPITVNLKAFLFIYFFSSIFSIFLINNLGPRQYSP